MERLDGLDSAFLSLETPTSHLHIAAVLVMDPPEGRRSLFSPSTRFAQIRRQIEGRLHLVPPFRQRPVAVPFGLGHPVWVDDPGFDLDDHLVRAALPEPGGRAELDRFVADYAGRPLHRDRPLWEMVVVEGLAGDRTALVAKIHHAILDGVSGASLLGQFFDLAPRGEPVTLRPPPFDPPPLPSAVELLRRGTADLIHPGRTLTTWGRALPALAGIPAGRRGPVPDTPVAAFSAPRSRLNGPLSPRRRYASADVALADVRLVRHAFGTTVTDVILAAVGDGLHRLLGEAGQLPDRSLLAMVPVSTRAEEESGLGNRVSAVLGPLATDRVDPVDRLLTVSEAHQVAKEAHGADGGRLLADVAETSAPAVVATLARAVGGLGAYDRLPPLANVIVSSVPGPDFPVWCAGGRVRSLAPVGPVAHGIGLNVTTFTYEQTLTFGILGCARLVPEVDRLAELVAAGVGRLVTEADRRRGAAG